MRIHAIRGCNLASLAGEFGLELDRAPLSHAGLFAITGPTGAGKSTLLDALCVALFDKTPRLHARSLVNVGRADEDDAERLSTTDVRNLLRHGTGSAWAEVEWSGRDGRRYSSRWSVHRARNRPDGRIQTQHMELRDLETGRELGGTRSETLATIEARLGFSFEQFRRAALLAQGEFAAFLQASARERAELLERMTGTEIYGLVSEAAYRRARAEQDSLAELHMRESAQPVLDDDARRAIEAERVAAGEELEAARAVLAIADAALAWHARAAELAAQVTEAEAAHAACERAWTDAAAWRAELDRALGARAYAEHVGAVDRAREGVVAAERDASRADIDRVARVAVARSLEEAFEAAAEARTQAHSSLERAAPDLEAAARLDTALELAAPEAAAAETARAEAAAAAEAAATACAQAEQGGRAAAERLAAAERWLTDHAYLAPVAAEWPRWAAALERIDHGNRALAAIETDRDRAAVADAKARAVAKARAEDRDRAKDELEKQRSVAEKAEQIANRHPAVDLRRERERKTAERAALQQVADAARAAAAAAADRTAAEAERDSARAESTKRAKSIKSAAARLRRAAVARDEAERAYDQLRLAVELDAHRASLVDGESCPLCGATEHPWAADASPIHQALEAQRARVDTLRADVSTLETARAELDAARASGVAAIAALDVRIDAAHAAHAAARTAWVRGVQSMGELPLIDDPASADAHAWAQHRLDAIDDVLTKLRTREDELTKLEQTATHQRAVAESRRTHFDAEELRLAEARERERTAAARVVDLAAARDRALADRAARLAELDAPFAGVTQWRERAVTAAAALAAELARDVDVWTRATDAARTARDAVATFARTASAAAEKLADRAAARDRAADSAAARREKLDELRAARRAFFDGRSVGDVRRALADAARAADSACDAARTHLAEARQDLTAAGAKHTAALERLTAARTSLLDAQSTLAAALQAAALDEPAVRALLAHDAAWIQTHTHQRDLLRAALDTAVAVRTERRTQLARHQATEPPDLDVAAAHAERDRATSRVATALERTGGSAAQLRIDDEARQRRAELTARIAAQADRAALYESLSTLIGSADGKKFRTFAQSLTLDVLLAHANQHLTELADRYRLVRVPGYDLDLQIIDRDMGDDVRSINSLSGGESFLVSLALALGLSSLSARDTRVESLLIDEGFGSLDPSTLETALSVLDALQATGRKVGLISHVPGLAERIGVRVTVTPRGGGRSTIRVLE